MDDPSDAPADHLSQLSSAFSFLDPADIASAPRCSMEEHIRHRAMVASVRPTPENNQLIASIFVDFINDHRIYREIKAICRTMHSLITFDFARLLNTLEDPLIRLADLSELPSFTLRLFSEILDSLKIIETNFRTALDDLEDLEILHQIPSATLQAYSESLSCSVISQMLCYWIESSMEAVRRCQAECARVEWLKSQSRPSVLSSPQLSNLNPIVSSPVSPRSNFLDLHKVRINKFSGRPEEFAQFFGVLNNALDSNPSYSEMTKITFFCLF